MDTNKPNSLSSISGDTSPNFFPFSRFIFFLQVFIGTGFFSGYSPIVPGTVGSLIGLIGMVLLPTHWTIYSIVLSFILIAGTWASEELSKRWGNDPKRIVIDEVAGMIIVLCPFPKTVAIYITGFILFRLLDIIKPYPCRMLERIHGGIGIMLDDVMAALYSCILLYGIFIFL